MIDYKKIENGVEIFYNNKLIIKHHKKKPAFFVGSGTEEIEHYRGNFKIDDFIEFKLKQKLDELDFS